MIPRTTPKSLLSSFPALFSKPRIVAGGKSTSVKDVVSLLLLMEGWNLLIGLTPTFKNYIQRHTCSGNNIQENTLRVVQRGIHFTFEINLGGRRIRHGPTRKLNDVIFNQFWVDLDVSHPEISITSQRIELRNSGFDLPSGLPLIKDQRTNKVGITAKMFHVHLDNRVIEKRWIAHDYRRIQDNLGNWIS